MATVASGLNGGAGYNSSDTITSTTLNNHVNNATVTGIVNADVEILGRTKNWLYYDVPTNLIKKENRSFYKGQRQIWFLLRFNGLDTNITFPRSRESEFDAWKWIEFSEAPNMVIQFKKHVYCSALLELAPIVFESSKLEDIKIKLSL